MYKKTLRRLEIGFISIGSSIIVLGIILCLINLKSGVQLMESPGIPFLFAGILLLIIRKRKEKQQRRLKEIGKVIYADVVSVQQSTYFRVNMKYVYRIIAQYVDESMKTVHQYHSEYIVEYPAYAKPGEKVPIYIAPNNHKKYYMDINTLLAESGYRVEML